MGGKKETEVTLCVYTNKSRPAYLRDSKRFGLLLISPEKPYVLRKYKRVG